MPGAAVPPAAVTVKPIVACCTDSLNVAVTVPGVTATPDAPFDGVVPVTVGGVVSGGGGAAVVNDQVAGAAIVLPAVSFAPDSDTLYVVLAARLPDGVNVAVLFVSE